MCKCSDALSLPVLISREAWPQNSLYYEVTYPFFGGDSEEDTPVPIPNTEVKLFSADGTAWVTMWESRTVPDFLMAPEVIASGAIAFLGSPARLVGAD